MRTAHQWVCPGRVLAQLRERQGASPAPASGPGLSHFAPQVPTPADLSRFEKHYTATHTDAELTDPSRSAAVMTCGTTRRRSASHHVDAIPPGRERLRWEMRKPAGAISSSGGELESGEV